MEKYNEPFQESDASGTFPIYFPYIHKIFGGQGHFK